MLGSRERTMFDVIFDRIKKVKDELTHKEQEEVELERKLNFTEAKLLKKSDRVKKLKEERLFLQEKIIKMQCDSWRSRIIYVVAIMLVMVGVVLCLIRQI